jgi:aspartate/methionine/tyrosine aminotransferase
LPELREAISGWYAMRFGLDIAPERIVVTAGASAALLLACLLTLEPGDEMLMPDPSYPCNRQFVAMAGGKAVLVPAGPAERFQLSAETVHAHWGARTRGVVLASPSNPTGTSLDAQALSELVHAVRLRGGFVIADEIYLGLSFAQAGAQSALALGDDIISVNSFSKYFAMTGWRLGWLVLPPSLVTAAEVLAQHLFICPSTLAQRAALACFHPESLAECEARRWEFKARRDAFVPRLQALGFGVPVTPDGAFYVWANAKRYAQNLGYDTTWDLGKALVERAHVVLTPGRDFGEHDVHHYVRFSIASAPKVLEEACNRMADLQKRGGR